jgi:hypothetical protein
MDGENEFQDIERELYDMLKDIDSMSPNSSKALKTLDSRSSVRSQRVTCFESS